MTVREELSQIDLNQKDRLEPQEDKLVSLRRVATIVIAGLIVSTCIGFACIAVFVYCFATFPFETMLGSCAFLALTGIILIFQREYERKGFKPQPLTRS